MKENDKNEKLAQELKHKFDNLNSSQLKEIYQNFQNLSSILYRISDLKIDLEKLKNKSKSSSKLENSIYLVISLLVILSLFYFDKIEYTIFVMFIYFTHEIDRKNEMNKNEILISQKENEINSLVTDCFKYHLEISETNYLSDEIKKQQKYINPTEYFYSEINSLILRKLTEKYSEKENLEYFISVQDEYKN
jgi:hypothetical protein